MVARLRRGIDVDIFVAPLLVYATGIIMVCVWFVSVTIGTIIVGFRVRGENFHTLPLLALFPLVYLALLIIYCRVSRQSWQRAFITSIVVSAVGVAVFTMLVIDPYVILPDPLNCFRFSPSGPCRPSPVKIFLITANYWEGTHLLDDLCAPYVVGLVTQLLLRARQATIL